MNRENLNMHEPTSFQMIKYYEINSMPEEMHEAKCVYYDNCSICPMAIHQFLLSTTKHHCVYGMSEDKFLSVMSDADCAF